MDVFVLKSIVIFRREDNSCFLAFANRGVVPRLTPVQSCAIRRDLGCVNSCPAARGFKEAGFPQPRTHLIAHFCSGLRLSHFDLRFLFVRINMMWENFVILT